MPSKLSTIHLDIVETNIPIIYLKIDKKFSYLKVSKCQDKLHCKYVVPFLVSFFLGKSYTCFGLCKGSNIIMLNPCFAFYRLCYLGVCFKDIFV